LSQIPGGKIGSGKQTAKKKETEGRELNMKGQKFRSLENTCAYFQKKNLLGELH